MAQIVTRVPMDQAEITKMVGAVLGQISKIRWQKINLLLIHSKITRKDPRIEGLTLDEIRTSVVEIFQDLAGENQARVSDKNGHGECTVIMDLE